MLNSLSLLRPASNHSRRNLELRKLVETFPEMEPVTPTLDDSRVSDSTGQVRVSTELGLGSSMKVSALENGVKGDDSFVVVKNRVVRTEVLGLEIVLEGVDEGVSKICGGFSGSRENGIRLGLHRENGNGDVKGGGLVGDGEVKVWKDEDIGFVEDDSGEVVEADIDGDGAVGDEMKESRNRETRDGEDEEMRDPMPEMTNSGGSEDDNGEERANRGEEDDEDEDDDGEEGEEDEFEEDDDDDRLDDQEHGFSVGDYVWGKIRSHPWWPGQIYDPSDASKKAARYKRKDRLLVAYFGDGTFAWCYPSQLKPFQENYEQMVKQSTSKIFLNAVEEVVEAIGRRVELEMTCSCVRAKDLTKFNNPLATNAGIREGVFVPDGGIGELSIVQFDPVDFIESLQGIAQVVSVSDQLELVVLKSQLSAFYFAKGYSHMPCYYEPMRITDLDDITKKDIPVADPNPSVIGEDWISSPVSSAVGGAILTSSQKWPGISEDKLYQRKKQRRMSELMVEDVEVELDENSESDEEAFALKLKSASSKRKKKKDPNFEEDSGGNSKKTKKTKRSGNRASNVKNDGVVSEKGNTLSSSLRERKKSKYLSAPYLDVKQTPKSVASTKESETENPRKSSGSSLGERMKKVAGQFMGSSLVKCDSVLTSQENRSNDPLTPTEKEVVFEEESALPHKLLSDLSCAASDPLHVNEDQSSDTLLNFFTRLRSSSYSNGSDFGNYNNSLSGRGHTKRISVDTKSASAGEGTNDHENEFPTSQGNSGGRKRKSKEIAAVESPKKKDLKVSNNDTSAGGAALLCTFYPGESLPSKTDLIAVFSKFGVLNELETEMLTDSNVARVVFFNSSDAEEAYNISEEDNPFHSSIISYRIRYLSAPSSASKNDGPSLSFIRQSLEITNSVLEKSWDKLSARAKANLEHDVKELLEKVNSTAESSSSKFS
ncbi:hypothetical protein GIB67_004336 [Kingdonia uniflora]|uniref:PWWP domain-containing protein n=1 Tax=Kingdonia uniflora TaxID=39325 RepID=A0A7J7MRS5_9MAGN|nr:hypothetical protein GIB67_004336 [Kingdonia uniflora]